jgi:vacuolar-type H+-ATPase subunit E/Vma4
MTATTMTASAVTSLEPLEQALLRRATDAADAIRADAAREAAAAVEAAQREAAATVAQARAEGEADAARRQAEDRGGAHRAARGIVLAAQRAVYDELRAQARAVVRELLAEPDTHRRLVALVQAQLGTQADAQPHPSGGIVGEARDGRRVDASVDALVERVVGELDLDPLWAPR